MSQYKRSAYNTVMSRYRSIILCAVLVLAIGAGFVTAIGSHLRPSARVYSVTEVRIGLQHDPRHWNGRTVLVQGWIDGGGGINCLGYTASNCATAWIRFAPSPTYYDSSSGHTEFDILLPHDVALDEINAVNVPFVVRHIPIIGPLLVAYSKKKTLRVHLSLTSSPCVNIGTPCYGGLLIP